VKGGISVPNMWYLPGFRVSYQALYSYTPQNDDELELRDGDIVDVMEKCDDGWFVGECGACLSAKLFEGRIAVLGSVWKLLSFAG